MKKIFRKILTGALVVTVSLNTFAPWNVLAAETENQNVTESQEETQTQENSDETEVTVTEDTEKEAAEETEESVTENESTQESESATEDDKSPDETENQDIADTSEELLINYLYIAYPYLETPGTQEIVLSIGTEGSSYENVQVSYSNEAGAEETLSCEKQVDNTYLFTRDFQEGESGIYKLEAVYVFQEGVEKEYRFDDFGISAYFGVDKEYEGSNQSEHMTLDEYADGETAEESDGTVSVDESEEGQEEIVQALESAESQLSVQNSAVSLYSADTRAGNVIVVLDPGHDASHAGARGNGVNEEEATLKIAQYCKEELEQYSGVTVYMTRTTAACPYPETVGVSSGNILDIRKRVAWAADKGADSFISFHLNSAGSTARGAEVYYTIGSSKGAGLAEEILDELVALGLNRRKTAEADYAVNTESAKYGFPGLIIEHAFVSNSSDANNYLSTDAQLKRLGVADATAIANYYGLQKGYWKEVNGEKYYYLNGQKVYGEMYLEGGWRYFDETTGAMATGWTVHHGNTYYYDSNGYMLHGEAVVDGAWRYFDAITGVLATGWSTHDGHTYYYDSEGRMVYGEVEMDGNKYYFHEITGVMATGLTTRDGNTYYYDSKGRMVYGEVFANGGWRYFDDTTGIMVTGWKVWNGHTYYYDSNGCMVHGEAVVDGAWRYFDSITGIMATGWTQLNGNTYYYDEDGAMCHGKTVIDNKVYYFDDIIGVMKTNVWIDNEYYGPDGVCTADFHEIEGTNTEDVIDKMVALFNKNNPGGYPSSELSKGGAPDLETFCRIYYEEASDEGIRPEVAFCQSMIETGWLKFGGDVKISQFNFAGLGATGNGVSGSDFSKYGEEGVRMGVRAQIQHLKAYASSTITEDTLAHDCVDERFRYVNKGCAVYVEWLGIQENPYGSGWASAANYGYRIVELMEQMENADSGNAGKPGDSDDVLSGWVYDTASGKTYYYENGTMLKSCERYIDGAWRWFESNGVMAVSKDVYLSSNGGKWVHYNQNGEMVKGWYDSAKGRYYFDLVTGAMAHGVAKIEGKNYYFYQITGILIQAKSKEMVVDGAWRWFESDGQVAVSKDVYLASGNKWVRYNAKAEMVKGWDTNSKGRYYFDLTTGAMLKGRQTIAGRVYYFDVVTGIC